MARMAISRKTGKRHAVNAKRSKAAKRAAAHRKGKKLSQGHRTKISKGVKRAWKTGKTKHGRKTLFKNTLAALKKHRGKRKGKARAKKRA